MRSYYTVYSETASIPKILRPLTISRTFATTQNITYGYTLIISIPTALKRHAPSGLIFLMTKPRLVFNACSNLRSLYKRQETKV